MIQIPKSHKLAHRAVLAVSDVLGKIGALTECIKNDYGEDLLVQTSLRDSADNFTLLIQVKGTQRALNADGGVSLSIDVNHLHRWASHSQPILVCLYNETNQIVYAFSPRHSISLWEISASRYKTKTIRLGTDDEFNPATASRFIWDCRIEHYARMLAWHESNLTYMVDLEGSSRRRNHTERELNLISFRFLQDVGVLDGDDLQSGFRKLVDNASRSFERDRRQDAEADLRPIDAIGLALLGHVESVSGGSGVPGILFERCSRLLKVFFKDRHAQEWRRIVGRFPAAEGARE